jgi:hypothetical protein
MQGAINIIHGDLALGKIPNRGVDMRIKEAGRDSGAAGVDHPGVFSMCNQLPSANCSDNIIFRQDRIARKNRAFTVSADNSTDIGYNKFRHIKDLPS